ncbi:MAG: DDE-type integrase/transposase/recombinase, partial [Nitrosopumilus sp.]|nr:DDE-type integrase/transposase/recombinase [Nitrosopumilus sp.]
YIDDVCIYSKTFEQHMVDIEKVFNKLSSFNWKLKLKKCQFAQERIQYLGHIVSHNQIAVHPKNIDKIKHLKRPTSVKETQMFLGSVNYYRRFIPNLTALVEPLLVNLRGKRDAFIWNEEQDDAYSKILALLCEQPILRMPDYNLPFILKTDASKVGYGGQLAQDIDGIMHPIAFFSGRFKDGQAKTWNHWQKEAFAVIFGIKKFDHYLKPKPFTLITDNESILYLLKPEKAMRTAMIDRWGVFLQSYNYTLKHTPGSKLYIEDGLSRSTNFYHITTNQILQEQKKDTQVQIVSLLVNKKIPDSLLYDKKDIDLIQNWISQHKMQFIIENDILYYIDAKDPTIKRVVIPSSLETKIIDMYHSLPISGHLGTEKTYDKLRKHVWFPDMHSKISYFRRDCSICRLNQKSSGRVDNLHPIKASRPFELIQMDHCGPFPLTQRGNQYCLTIIDHFSRKRWFIPVKSTDANEVFESLLTHIIGPFETPQTILTDMGSAFTSIIAKEITKMTGIEPTFSLPGAKDTMGSVERSNQVMEDIIRKLVNKEFQDDWDIYLPLAANAINTCKADNHQFSPDFLVFGREPRNPFLAGEKDIDTDPITYSEKLSKTVARSIDLANKTLDIYRHKMKLQVNPVLKTSKFKVDDIVCMAKPPEMVVRGLSKKLDNRNLGPYIITHIDETKGNVTIQIAPETFHIVKMKHLQLLDKNTDVSFVKKYDPNNPRILPSKFNEIV